MATDISNIKFRIVMDVHGQQRFESKDELQDLQGEQMYTFNGESMEPVPDFSAKSRQQGGSKKSAHLDLVAENCKLESIIEQYRLTNERLKTQLLDIQENNSKADLLVETIKGFFLDIKRRGLTDKPLEHKEENSTELVALASKISEAIEGKECNYLKECLKEFSSLVDNYKSKNNFLEKEVVNLNSKLDLAKRNQEVLEFEMKDVMKTAQEISNADTDKPVNIYQMKKELRNRLKSLDKNPEVLTINFSFSRLKCMP